MFIKIKGFRMSHIDGLNELLVEVDEEGLTKMMKLEADSNKKECKECNGEGKFSNEDGSDWMDCEICLGEGTE